MAANSPQGVYKNLRLMHACTTVVGSTVHLQTKDGSIWEGILSTFSPEFTICLEYAVQIDPKLSDPKDSLFSALKSGSQVKKQAFFDLKDIVRISALDVDLSYATKEANASKLATDADISGYDANKSANLGEHRQLESWQDDEGDGAIDDSSLTLDDVALSGNNKNDSSQNDSRGWDAQEMFRYNERVHKVATTYDDKLTDYTLPLPKHSTKEWRKKQERAAAIAKEIEGNTKSQNRLAKEDENDDEEEKYSAVLRPLPNTRTQPTITKTSVESPEVAPEEQKSSTGLGSHRPMPGRQNGAYKTYRNPRFERNTRIDSLKNFGKQLNLTPSPRQPRNQNPTQSSQNPSSSPNQTITHQQQQQPLQQQQQPKPPAHQQTPHQASSQSPHHHQPQQTQQSTQQVQPPSQQQQQQQQQQPHHQQQQHPHPHQQHQQQPPQTQPANQQSQQHHQQSKQQPPQHSQQQAQGQNKSANANPSPIPTITTSSVNTSTISERSDSSSMSKQTDDHQSELARKSKLNPNAKEFKPRSPGANQIVQNNGANSTPSVGASTIDPTNSSPMSQVPHTPYYQTVSMIPVGLSPHQQQHHAAQFMPNHTHPHFQNQIHYMSPVPHFQQMPQRYVRGNFQNYHRGEHHNNGRPDYSQGSMMAPTSTGHQFVPSPSGAPHPMNAYAASQQAMIYGAPPQSMYPVVQAGFPQHMSHVMSNPPPYDGSAVYGVPPQTYIVNPQ